MKKEPDEELKLILLGESGVGKTSIIERYLYDKFNEKFCPSTTMNYAEKDIEIGKKTIRLNIWDTIGQEKYRSISKLFLNDTKIVILVYSIDDSKSFTELEYWNKLAKEQIDQDVFLGIVGNKSDLYLEQQVSEIDGKKYAEDNKAIFAQLSAKDNRLGIIEYMNKLVKEYFKVQSQKKNSDNKELRNKEKGIVLSNERLNTLGYNEGGCCGGKAKARRKKYEDILNNNNGEIDSIFLGGDRVGKTSLIKRIDGKNFDENEKHTEDMTKYETKYFNSTMKITVNIYDINNDKKKNNLLEQTLIKSQLYFLVYDLNDMRSINEVRIWLNVIKNLKKNKNSYITAIIGNKKDLIENKQQLDNNSNELRKLKQEHLISEDNTIFYYISAKNNHSKVKDIIGITVEKFINLP